MAEAGPGDIAQLLDKALLTAHPLASVSESADKNSRGRVLCVGGSERVPGGLGLTAEAAFRAGAGKVQMAAPDRIVLPLGLALPEAAVFALSGETQPFPEDAACVCRQACASDAVVVGPAMTSDRAAGTLVDALLAEPALTATLILDAAALLSLRGRVSAMQAFPHPKILTPHQGELMALLDWREEEVAGDPVGAARAAAERYGAVVIAKGPTTFVAAPDGRLARYADGAAGLATGGSGDVLAGITAGLAARGGDAWSVGLWSVWLHGEAGRACAQDIGPVGFLAQELLPRIPRLMAG